MVVLVHLVVSAHLQLGNSIEVSSFPNTRIIRTYQENYEHELNKIAR